MNEPREYRVAWRREGWSATTSTKSRIFTRLRDARHFADRMAGRTDLPPLIFLRVDERPVGEWSLLEQRRPR